LIDTGEEIERAAPPDAPGDPGGPAFAIPIAFAPAPPFPPRPTITPLFISSTPPGNAPSIVSAGVLVLGEEIVTPELIVATTFEVPVHPAASADDLKFTPEPVRLKLN
jgi:hypothetical protein